MDIPFFYHGDLSSGISELAMPEETSRHIVSVLRMREGDPVRVVNGTGILAEASVSMAHKKHCLLQLRQIVSMDDPRRPVTIAISMLKNAARFEWMLEKVAEIGVRTVVPLQCARTERQHFRMERMKGILVSAMLQSKQAWSTIVSEPVAFGEFVGLAAPEGRFIAHCMPGNMSAITDVHQRDKDTLILVGPEGDFTPGEIELAVNRGYKPVTLGDNRLRTETAGVVAAALMCIR